MNQNDKNEYALGLINLLIAFDLKGRKINKEIQIAKEKVEEMYKQQYAVEKEYSEIKDKLFSYICVVASDAEAIDPT